MRLGQWIEREIKEGRATGLKDAYRQLAAEIGANVKAKGGTAVSPQTIENVAGGFRLRKYNKAKAIAEATKGAVTIPELCE